MFDGALAVKYPNSKGKAVVIRIDCYNVPKEPVESFIRRFASGVLLLPDYAASLSSNEFVAEIEFDIQFDAIN